MNVATKVLHATTVHPSDDSRILHKECKALAEAGYEVHYAAHDPAPPQVGNVRFISLGEPPKGRLRRMREGPRRLLDVIEKVRPAIVHLHDPELITLGRRLKRRGIITIYDSHENLPAQVREKHWIPGPAKPVAAAYARRLDRIAATLSAVVVATPGLADNFPTAKVAVVRNAPQLSEFAASSPRRGRRDGLRVAYVGGLSRIRGLFEGLEAVSIVSERFPGARFVVAGPEADPGILSELRRADARKVLDYRGVLGRPGIAALLAECDVGLVTLYATKNDMEALPIKMFEYMAAGLPIIASNHPFWRPFIDGEKTGLSVDPTNPKEIATSLAYLLGHPDEGRAMGERGRRFVYEEFNWGLESRTLLKLYEDLLAT